MTELLTAAQMRALEKAAIDSGATTGLELMERAGQGVVEAILEWQPALATTSRRAVILCGPGNNGGDGFVIARLLRQRGWRVEVHLYGDVARLPPDAARNCRRWQEIGEVRPSAELRHGPEADLYVDALFGTGLTRAVTGEARRALLELRGPVVSVDLPSGLCSDSGRRLGGDEPWPETRLTVSFHAPRLGHVLADGPDACGRVVIKDIGIDRQLAQRTFDKVRDVSNGVKRTTAGVVQTAAAILAESGVSADLLGKSSASHKYGHGHVLVLSGGVGKGGAARLAARGALRIGAGLVTVGCPLAALAENASRLDAVMLRAIDGPDALTMALEDKRLGAILIGPGHGGGTPTREMVLAALASGRPMVLDADALTAFADDRGTLFEALHEECVLTPHGGEFARLFPRYSEMIADVPTRGPARSKVDATRVAAVRAGCTVLFKGADTVIADQTGAAAVNPAHGDRAAPWLATAGAGDVLAGFIAGLMARGFAPKPAAETAAWLHVECARHFGPGLIAEDLPDQLPAVFRALGVA